MQIINLTQVNTLISTVLGYITSNIAPVLILVGAIVGMSIAMALFDQAASDRKLDAYGKLWKR